jgi:hypothetical protein
VAQQLVDGVTGMVKFLKIAFWTCFTLKNTHTHNQCELPRHFNV